MRLFAFICLKEVPNLITPDELGETFCDSAFEKAMNEAGVNTGTIQEKYSFFVRRRRENLHVVLSVHVAHWRRLPHASSHVPCFGQLLHD
jgi:hypothetical protein